MLAFLSALVVLLSVAVLLWQYQRAELRAALYQRLALRGLREMEAAIVGAAAAAKRV